MQNIFLGFFAEAILRTAILIGIFMTSFFAYALYKMRNDIVDIVWGIGFVVIAWFNFYMYGFRAEQFPGVYGPFRMHVFLVALVVTIWGVRLATHIALRNKGKGEDFRYKNWRDTWGKWFVLRSYIQIFMLQGFLMLLISLPLIAVSIFGINSISWITILGFLAWLKGFTFESVGDYQLSKFIKNPENKGKIMTKGLWSFTRHPNYFGEVTQWWGIYIMALPITLTIVQASSYVWLIALLSPITITFLILKVSGIPMLEKKYEGNPEFEEYKKRTSAFIPWFPRR
ncbi:MAG: DUF1295 domain-containing protein [Candidatus Pacebacteria bacterium]|nr:DUF1295 domain-containing protein [Candidatus Paceibacterota bacterium]